MVVILWQYHYLSMSIGSSILTLGLFYNAEVGPSIQRVPTGNTPDCKDIKSRNLK